MVINLTINTTSVVQKSTNISFLNSTLVFFFLKLKLYVSCVFLLSTSPFHSWSQQARVRDICYGFLCSTVELRPRQLPPARKRSLRHPLGPLRSSAHFSSSFPISLRRVFIDSAMSVFILLLKCSCSNTQCLNHLSLFLRSGYGKSRKTLCLKP